MSGGLGWEEGSNMIQHRKAATDRCDFDDEDGALRGPFKATQATTRRPLKTGAREESEESPPPPPNPARSLQMLPLTGWLADWLLR